MSSMNPVRLSELLDTYGDNPLRWPEEERAAALQLLASSAEARALREHASWLDAQLDQFEVAPARAQLRACILRGFPPPMIGWRVWLRELWQELGGWRLVTPAFAASLFLGAMLPNWVEQSAADLPDEDLVADVQFIDDDFWVQP